MAAATLSHRYIADRQLPDKAIDLIPMKSGIQHSYAELTLSRRLDGRRIIQLKLEQQALMKESDEAVKTSTRMKSWTIRACYSELEEGGKRKSVALWYANY
ncbi:hypothetical protein KCP75_13980 [Salmonella enterica subsp. enterica]|nr:hypothetical protein KCP75_13980 [Salmonella enterica subsp. enterica]